ncbi:MAG: sporulation transcriptional regulator SpoIIID [Ruminococcus sp.]|nr:sporulation transcriptional regulator SpoIIID [Ruminococcus sp.]
MKDNVEERAVQLGEYIAKNNATVRLTAKKYNVSKSTVHKDVSERLKTINMSLYKQVRQVLDKNKQERHIRGGKATKEKYRKIAQSE